MYSSSVSISVLAVVAIQLAFIHTVLSLNETNAYLHHMCLKSEGIYKSGSKYNETKLRNTLSSLTEHMNYDGGIGSVVAGMDNMGNDSYSAKLQCRGDVSVSLCRKCLDTAIPAILKKCPRYKGRIIWYDNCFLFISTAPDGRTVDYKHIVYMHNAKDVSGNKKLFNKNVRAFLDKLKKKATRKEQHPVYTPDIMYATGEEKLWRKKLYGMVMCTRDLTIGNCTTCLDWLLPKFPKCCNGKQGGRIFSTTCTFRYEIYPFFRK